MLTRVQTGARLLFGLIFIVFGLNGFITVLPVPEFHPFMDILVDSGYIYLVKTIEVVGGILILFPRFAMLGLLLLTPVVVNICAYHAFLDSRNWAVSLILACLNVFLLIYRWEDFRNLIAIKARK